MRKQDEKLKFTSNVGINGERLKEGGKSHASSKLEKVVLYKSDT
jgi:hypothetical protein